MSGAKFAVSGQHYLFNVQTFASIVLSRGGDAYEYALRDRTTQGVIDDVASGLSELGVLVETTTTKDELERAFAEAGLTFVELIESAPRVALPASHPLVNAASLTLESWRITPTSISSRMRVHLRRSRRRRFQTWCAASASRRRTERR